MYHPFFQFVLPRLGQVALDALLYLNFLQLPPLQLVARWPVLYYGLPLVLMGVLAYISRDPLGLGIVFAGHLVTFYCIGTAIGLALRRIGGTPLTVWHIIWLDGITPWLLTGLIMWWGRRRALRLCTTKYSLTTRKNLPNGRLTIVQVSDVHPRACAAMDHTRIPELKAKIEACRPDLLVLTGDIFDEFTEPEELDAFCKLFGELDAPLGKYYVLGNHDLFHQKAEAAPLCEICGAADHGGAAARTCHKRTRHGRSVLLQVPVSAGRARGRAAAGGGQLRHPCRARRTVYLESSRSADRYRA